jgi:hypothetical protein
MAYPGFEPGPLVQKSDVLTTVLSGHQNYYFIKFTALEMAAQLEQMAHMFIRKKSYPNLDK